MGILAAGVRKFHRDVFPDYQRQFANLADGQRPLALLITCSDSRINPHLLTQTQPGQLFVMRNAGNIVPPYAPDAASGVAATVEYAVLVLKVEQIVVVGHECCGAMQALLNPSTLDTLPSVRRWLRHGASARMTVDQLLPEETASPEDRVRLLVESNVAMQLAHLHTHPSVAAGMAAGTLRLRGWVYDFVHGLVRERNAANGLYEPLTTVQHDEPVIPTPTPLTSDANGKQAAVR